MTLSRPSKVRGAAILAGGKSSRMGREKALIEFQGQPLVSWVASVLAPIFNEVRIVTSSHEVAEASGLLPLTDQYPDRGPLGGIHAALEHFKEPAFIVACDMPFLNRALIEFMSSYFEGDALVPMGEFGPEPLHAVYDSHLSQRIAALLTSGERIPSLRGLLTEFDTRYIPFKTVQKFAPNGRCFTNWNTPEDIQGAQERA